jgi:hypothetical protein
MQKPGRPAAPEPVVRTSRSAQGPVVARRQDRAGPPTASAAGRAGRPDSQVRRQREPSPGHPPRASRASTRARTMRVWTAAAGSSAWRLDRTAISRARQPGPASLQTPNSAHGVGHAVSSPAATGVPGDRPLIGLPSLSTHRLPAGPIEPRSRMLRLWFVLVVAAPSEGERRW